MSQPQDRIQESWEDDLEPHEQARDISWPPGEEEPFTPADIGFGIVIVLVTVGALYALDWCAEVIRAARILAS